MVGDRVGEVGDRACEGQAAGLCGTGFTMVSLADVGARDGAWGSGIEIGNISI